MRKLSGKIDGQEYAVLIGQNMDSERKHYFEEFSDRILFSSPKLPPTEIQRLKVEFGNKNVVLTDDGESCKSLANYSLLINELLGRGFPRNGMMSYSGGGTLGDLVGFVSSTYKRGTRFSAIPTTLLAQVDSSIGGKNGLNVASFKNSIGTFHLPEAIFCDSAFLSKGVMRDGLSEVIKYGMINDPKILDSLRGHRWDDILDDPDLILSLVERSVRTKMAIVEKDFRDTKGVRAQLNFGHTVGHALESVSGNSLSHGQAVCTGMIIESRMSELEEISERGTASSLVGIFGDLGIDVPDVSAYSLDSMVNFVLNDKKLSAGEIRIPVPVRPGFMASLSLTPERFKKILSKAIGG